MQTQRLNCSRSICVVAADSLNWPHAQGMGSFTPQWNAPPQRGQVALGSTSGSGAAAKRQHRCGQGQAGQPHPAKRTAAGVA